MLLESLGAQPNDFVKVSMMNFDFQRWHMVFQVWWLAGPFPEFCSHACMQTNEQQHLTNNQKQRSWPWSPSGTRARS